MLSASLIIGTIVVAIFGAIIPLIGLLNNDTLGSELEKFIVSSNPQNVADIERSTFEYHNKISRERIL